MAVSNFDFAFLRDLCETFARFAVKGFRGEFGHSSISGIKTPSTAATEFP
jgi:hypothetical protein